MTTPDLRAEVAAAHRALLYSPGAMRFVLDKLGLADPAALVLLDVGVMRVESWTGLDGATAWQPWDGDRGDGSAAVTLPVYEPTPWRQGRNELVDLLALDPNDDRRYVRRKGGKASDRVLLGRAALWQHDSADPRIAVWLYPTPMAWLRGAAAALAAWRQRLRQQRAVVPDLPAIPLDLRAHGLCVLDEAVNLEELLWGVECVVVDDSTSGRTLMDRLKRERRARRDREPPLPAVVVPAPQAAANPGIAASTADRGASNTAA